MPLSARAVFAGDHGKTIPPRQMLKYAFIHHQLGKDGDMYRDSQAMEVDGGLLAMVVPSRFRLILSQLASSMGLLLFCAFLAIFCERSVVLSSAQKDCSPVGPVLTACNDAAHDVLPASSDMGEPCCCMGPYSQDGVQLSKSSACSST